jgi:hypothetical protein
MAFIGRGRELMHRATERNGRRLDGGVRRLSKEGEAEVTNKGG